MHQVTFFTKPDCSLCHAAMYVLRRLRARHPFDLRKVDITAPGNEAWHQAYGEHIPVVHLNGREVFRHCIDEHGLGDLLCNADAK